MRGNDAIRFLDGGGFMAAAVRDFDWGSTSLGPIEAWPPSLRTAVGMLLSSRFPKCIVWAPDLVTIYNDAFRPILGDKPEALGRPFSEVWGEAWDTIGPIAKKAFAGEATFIEDFPLVIDRHGHPEQAWFTFCYSPIRDETGRVAGMMDTVIETTGKVLAERSSRFANAELAHRMKNMLAMVSAMANQTFRSTVPLSEAKKAFAQRLSALGEAHATLTEGTRSGAPIRTVIEGALSPFRTESGRISVEGPPLDLSARQALSLGLAVHELATNAVKYGALSADAGRVRVWWKAGRPGSGDEFLLVWEEHGGPAVEKPKRRGFGSRMVEQALTADFSGQVRIAFEPHGLRCALSTSMMKVGTEPEESASGSRSTLGAAAGSISRADEDWSSTLSQSSATRLHTDGLLR